MHVEVDGTRTYSHTSLSLWRLCKRRWFNRYVLHKKEPTSIAAAWSVAMVHRPLELTGSNQILSDAQWLACFESFRTEIGDPNFEDHIHTLGTGQRIFEAIRKTAPGLSECQSELQVRIPISGFTSYSSRPDVMGFRDGRRYTVDFKYTERAWRTATQPWPLKPLLAYDDQLLGQAITSEACGFIRATIAVEPKSGKISGPIYEEKLVDGQLCKEWLAETKATINEIETWLTMYEFEARDGRPTDSWPKNQDACFAFGRECPYMLACKTGWACQSGFDLIE